MRARYQDLIISLRRRWLLMFSKNSGLKVAWINCIQDGARFPCTPAAIAWENKLSHGPKFSLLWESVILCSSMNIPLYIKILDQAGKKYCFQNNFHRNSCKFRLVHSLISHHRGSPCYVTKVHICELIDRVFLRGVEWPTACSCFPLF